MTLGEAIGYLPSLFGHLIGANSYFLSFSVCFVFSIFISRLVAAESSEPRFMKEEEVEEEDEETSEEEEDELSPEEQG